MTIQDRVHAPDSNVYNIYNVSLKRRKVSASNAAIRFGRDDCFSLTMSTLCSTDVSGNVDMCLSFISTGNNFDNGRLINVILPVGELTLTVAPLTLLSLLNINSSTYLIFLHISYILSNFLMASNALVSK